VREATLYDIFATFHRLLRETESEEPRRIVYDEVPMEQHIERILGAVEEGGGKCDLLAVLTVRRDRRFVLGTFLAVLELMKEEKIFAVHRPVPEGAPEGAEAAIDVVLQDSEEGRSVLESIRERARRLEEETPEGRPKRRPPWAKGARKRGKDGAPEPASPPVAPEGETPPADGPPSHPSAGSP
jgi:hypothetical protein